MSRLTNGLRAALKSPPRIRNETRVATVSTTATALNYESPCQETARKLSAVDRCLEILSDSVGKLPVYVVDRQTRQRVDHPLNRLLSIRANELQTPSVAKKMIEANRLAGGNGYGWIVRDELLRPVEIIPVPYELVTPFLDITGRVWYTVVQPFTGEVKTVHRVDMIHTMAYTHDGWRGISVLRRASEVIATGRSAQQYSESYYANGGQPAGVLQTDTDLSGTKKIKMPDGSTKEVNIKDLLRDEWEARHSGPTNAQRIAILDYGLKYTPISVSNRDAQFIEQAELSVQDIARFFGVPLYKLQAGKQSYSSNEQNAIEYVVGTLHPIITQYEEELTYKLLSTREAERLRVRINMMAELRGDFTSRSAWYRTMREIGAYSVNDILELEDQPDVDGGDERYASLNYVPLADWRRLSEQRNAGGGDNR